MRRLFVLPAVLLLGCASISAPSQLDDVLASPERFNGRSVQICGWFVSGMETCTLSPAGTSSLRTDGQIIWVTPKSDTCLPANALSSPQATWAVVDGTFHTGGSYGHLGLFQNTLVGGKVVPIQGGCSSSGSAPNNSFKPKPLRGSA